MESSGKLLKIIVALSSTVSGSIIISESDDPLIKSQEFLSSQNLDKDLLRPLTKFIKTQQAKKFKTLETTQRTENFSKSSSKASHLKKVSERLLKHSYRYSKKLSSVNYGKFLYEKGVQLKQKTKKEDEKQKKMADHLNKTNLTFKPKISEGSKKIVESMEKNEKIMKTFEKNESLKRIKEERENKECYFTPAVESRKRVNSSSDIFEDLYKDACIRMEKSLKLKESFSASSKHFSKPDLNHSLIDNMVERLSNSHKITEEIIELKRREAQAPFDPETGQRYFTPLVMQNYSSIREERTVWEDLYNSRSFKRMPVTDRVSLSANKNSTKLFNSFKTKQFSEIFKTLDSDRDGKISHLNMKESELDSKILEHLDPVVNILEKNQNLMDFHEFCEKMEVVYQKLGFQDKRVLMTKVRKNQELREFPFKPKINEKSQIIGNNSYLGDNLYERGLARRAINELKRRKKSQFQEL